MIYPDETQTASEVALHYNDLDKYYRQLWGQHLHHGFWEKGDESVEEATEKLIELVAEAGHIGVGNCVCDVGCGYGGTSRYLTQNKGAILTSLTVSEAQLRVARAQDGAEGNPNYLLCDFLNNSLPSDAFDAVISIESSEHMANKGRFFDEVMRILKPGGRFVTCVWLAKNTPAKWETKHFLEPICREGRLPSMGSENDYREMMEKRGFEEICCRDISSNVKKTWAICAKRTLKAFFTDRELRGYVLDKKSSERAFAKTLLRILAAYNMGSMRYGLFSAKKL